MIDNPLLGPLLAEGKTKLIYAYQNDPVSYTHLTLPTKA